MKKILYRFLLPVLAVMLLMAAIPAQAEGTAALTQAAETAAPAQTAETAAPAQAEGAADSRVTGWLAEQAQTQKDPWVIAILEAGARDIVWEEGKATFSLRGFDPGLKALGAYAKAEDRAAWRAAAAENYAAYGLKAELAFEADGTPNKRSAAALLSQIRNAAGAAKGAFGKKDMADAVAGLLFPAPTKERNVTAETLLAQNADFERFLASRPELFAGSDASAWAALFHVQRAWKLNIKQGPHSVKMSWDGVDPVKLMNQAYDAVTDQLASVPAAQRAPESQLPGLWKTSLAQAAVKAKKGRLVSHSAVFDLDDLFAGTVPEEYTAYLAGFTPGIWFGRLTEGYRAMPEAASQPMPKTGVITKVKKGRGVTIKVDKDGRNTYVQMRDADTGVIVADAFITPGKNVTMKVPEGVYVVHYATGSTWYGTEAAFGPLGDYQASNEFIVAKKKWVLKAGQEQEGITLHEITAADMAPTEDRSIHVLGKLEPEEGLLRTSYPLNNPVIPGVSSTTGLPASGEVYTPIIMVLDNAEEAYPHWGVSQADIIFQVPNAGAGATKLLGLFADHYPDQAGPVRSGRSTMLPAALSFDAAFAFAGPPAATGGEIDILEVMSRYDMNRTHRIYNLLNSNGYGERWKNVGSHNLSCLIGSIHQNLMNQGVSFEERPFLFTDEPRTEGEKANIIRVLHRGDDPAGASNSASRGVFKYNAETGTYIRTNSSGDYSDRLTGETIPFANVIVLRVNFSYDRNYIYLKNHMTGSGSAEIFQNGRYVRGAWVRTDAQSRLVLVDGDGSELKLQRGKTFIVITNEVTDVIYTE